MTEKIKPVSIEETEASRMDLNDPFGKAKDPADQRILDRLSHKIGLRTGSRLSIWWYAFLGSIMIAAGIFLVAVNISDYSELRPIYMGIGSVVMGVILIIFRKRI